MSSCYIFILSLRFSALKESGYESDSTLVFKRRDETQQQLSPAEQRQAYKTIQKGGEVPLHGLRKPVPDKPKGEFLCLCVVARSSKENCLSYCVVVNLLILSLSL